MQQLLSISKDILSDLSNTADKICEVLRSVCEFKSILTGTKV